MDVQLEEFIHNLIPLQKMPTFESVPNRSDAVPFSPLDPGQYIDPPTIFDNHPTRYINSPNDPLKPLYENMPTIENLPQSVSNNPLPTSLSNTQAKSPNTQIEPPVINPTNTISPTPEENEYQKAAQQVIQNQRNVAFIDGLKNIVKGLIGAGTGTTQDKLPDIKLPAFTEDLVRAPLTELAERDKGRKLQRELGMFEAKTDPNSEISKTYKSNVSAMLRRIGMPNLANQIEQGQFSAAQLEDMFGETNLNNLYINQLNNERIERMMASRLDAQKEKLDDKADKEMFRTAEKLRNEFNQRHGKAQEFYERANQLENLVNEIERARSLNDRNSLLLQAQAIVVAMKTLQQDNSVIRDSDQRLYTKPLGLATQIQSDIDSALKKGPLNKMLLNNMREYARSTRIIAAKNLAQRTEPLFKQAQSQNIDPTLIAPRTLLEDMRDVELLTSKIEKTPDGKIKITPQNTINFNNPALRQRFYGN